MTVLPVPDAAVIVVAAGSGTRLGAAEPKAFVGIDTHTVLWHALLPVFATAHAAQVIIVVPAGLEGEANTEAMDAAAHVAARDGASNRHELVTVVAGGATRQASVAAGLRALWPSVTTVLVHDAARSLTPAELFDRVIAEVERTGSAVIPGLPVVDTVKRREADGAVGETVDRDTLLAVQTPQGFRRDALVAAYANAGAEFTDDAALVAAAGLPVRALDGDARAFKITTPADLDRAQSLLARAEPAAAPANPATPASAPAMRVGVGTDVHAYAAPESTRTLWLAGLSWPGARPLEGHSDGDVVVHAIVDALLSLAGLSWCGACPLGGHTYGDEGVHAFFDALLSAADLGDIGGLFGTDDPAVEGAHADVFLGRTRERLAAAGWVVGNVSVQLQANRPKFSARRLEAQAGLSALLGAPVSVAATTTDGLGFSGRGEGIAAIATALIYQR